MINLFTHYERDTYIKRLRKFVRITPLSSRLRKLNKRKLKKALNREQKDN